MPNSKVADYVHDLAALPDDDVAGYLSDHSNLPGPRGNLSLLEAFARHPRAALAPELARSDDEYLAACGTAALGVLLDSAQEPERARLSALLTESATDERWRVREGAAMALQFLADLDPAAARDLARSWLDAEPPHPLALRAAIAGLCEPRLLAEAETAQLALVACGRATDALRAVAPEHRRDPDVRTLRQGLAYCWSVAVAGSPADGLPLFASLDTTDADVAWLVAQNRKKRRLAALLEP